jgi:xylono-1,5-lactonase
MTTDPQGNLWVAIWDGVRVEKLSPEGVRLGAVPIPTRRPTSCAWVDPDGDPVARHHSEHRLAG